MKLMHFISGRNFFNFVWRWIDLLDIHFYSLQKTLEKYTSAIKMYMKTNKNIELTQMKYSMDRSAQKTNFWIKYGSMRNVTPFIGTLIAFRSIRSNIFPFILLLKIMAESREQIDECARFELCKISNSSI